MHCDLPVTVKYHTQGLAVPGEPGMEIRDVPALFHRGNDSICPLFPDS